MDWLQHRNVKFAVGCTVLILFGRWLLTGDLLLAAAAVSEQPAEGDTKSFATVWAVVWPIFFEAMVIVGGSVIAFSIGLWDRVADFFGGQKAASTAKITVNDVAQDLLRAVALGDAQGIAKSAATIRREYAPRQIDEAIANSDYDRARQLISELESMTAKGGALAE